jgi:D-arabinose 1-dehydrogenase-like Zn-dependent alcohol dehydrogenase
VVINTVGNTAGFARSLDYVRDSGTVVEVGNFVDSGTMELIRQCIEKGRSREVEPRPEISSG